MGLWKKGKDKLDNGAILGAISGALIYFGEDVVAFLQETIPESAKFMGEWSLLIYSIGGFALLGYILDRY